MNNLFRVGSITSAIVVACCSASAWATSAPSVTPGNSTTVNGSYQITVTRPAGSVVHYTSNATEPTTSSLTLGFPANSNTTVINYNRTRQWRFAAYANGQMSSTELRTMTVAATDPAFSVSGGAYEKTISLSTDQAGATIRYTTNGATPTASSTVYSGPFNISWDTTVKAKAFHSAWDIADSGVSSTWIDVETLEPPVVTPYSGTYTNSVTANISIPSGATIYYTSNGTVPTTSSNTISSSFTYNRTRTFRFKTYKDGRLSDATTDRNYTIAMLTPNMNLSGSSSDYSRTMTLSRASHNTNDSVLEYRVNYGGWQTYSSPVALTSSTYNLQYRARSVVWDLANSQAGNQNVSIAPVPQPGISIAGNNTCEATITIAKNASNTNLYYTLDGSEPTTGSFVYQGPVTVIANTTVKAKNFYASMNSGTASAQATMKSLSAPKIYTKTETGSLKEYSGTGNADSTVHVGKSPVYQIVADCPDQSKVYVSTNGQTPVVSTATESIVPRHLSQSRTLSAISVRNGQQSAVSQLGLTVKANKPDIFVSDGANPTVELFGHKLGSVYYTTDGSTPTESSTVYTGGFTVNRSAGTRIRAISRVDQYSPISDIMDVTINDQYYPPSLAGFANLNEGQEKYMVAVESWNTNYNNQGSRELSARIGYYLLYKNNGENKAAYYYQQYDYSDYAREGDTNLRMPFDNAQVNGLRKFERQYKFDPITYAELTPLQENPDFDHELRKNLAVKYCNATCPTGKTEDASCADESSVGIRTSCNATLDGLKTTSANSASLLGYVRVPTFSQNAFSHGDFEIKEGALEVTIGGRVHRWVPESLSNQKAMTDSQKGIRIVDGLNQFTDIAATVNMVKGDQSLRFESYAKEGVAPVNNGGVITTNIDGTEHRNFKGWAYPSDNLLDTNISAQLFKSDDLYPSYHGYVWANDLTNVAEVPGDTDLNRQTLDIVNHWNQLYASPLRADGTEYVPSGSIHTFIVPCGEYGTNPNEWEQNLNYCSENYTSALSIEQYSGSTPGAAGMNPGSSRNPRTALFSHSAHIYDNEKVNPDCTSTGADRDEPVCFETTLKSPYFYDGFETVGGHKILRLGAYNGVTDKIDGFVTLEFSYDSRGMLMNIGKMTHNAFIDDGKEPDVKR